VHTRIHIHTRFQKVPSGWTSGAVAWHFFDRHTPPSTIIFYDHSPSTLVRFCVTISLSPLPTKNNNLRERFSDERREG